MSEGHTWIRLGSQHVFKEGRWWQCTRCGYAQAIRPGRILGAHDRVVLYISGEFEITSVLASCDEVIAAGVLNE